MWLAQTLIDLLLMSLVVGFVLIGANSGNAILLLGGGSAGLFMAWNLLQGTLKGLMNATDRLYKRFATAGETRESVGKAARAELSPRLAHPNLVGGGPHGMP